VAEKKKKEELVELTPEQRKTVDQNLDIVLGAATYEHARKPIVELEEFLSVGYMGLIDAVLRFDPEKGKDLETFARIKVRGAMRDAVRKVAKDARRRGIGGAESNEEDDPMGLLRAPLDVADIVDPATTLSTKLANEQLTAMAVEAKDELSPEFQDIAQALFIDEISVNEYVRRTGIRKATILRKRNQLRNILYARVVRGGGNKGGA